MLNTEKLKNARIEKGLSVPEVCLKLYDLSGKPVSYNSVYSWESGKSEIKANYLGLLSQIYGVNIGCFFKK